MHRPGMGPSFTPAYRPPTINTGPNMAAINAQRNYQSQMQMQHQNRMRFQQEQTMRTLQQNQQNMMNNMARQQQQQQMDRMRQDQLNNMHRQNMARVQQDQARMRDEHQRTLQNNLRRAADDQRRANEQRHRAEMDRHRARMNLLHTSNNNNGNNGYAANGGGGSPFTVYVNGVPLFSTPDPNDPSYTGESDGNVGIGVSAGGGYGGDDDLHLNAPLLANMFGPPSGNAQYYTGAGQQQQQPTISIPLARNNKGHIVIEDMSTEPLVRLLFFIGLAFFIVPPLCIVLIVLAVTSKTYYVELHESKKQLLIGTKRILTGGVSIEQKINFSDIASFELVSPLSGQITGIQFQSFSHQLLCAKTKTGVAYSLLSDTYGVQQDRLRQLREWLEKTNPTPPPPTAPPAEDGAGTSGNDGNGGAPENRGSETQSTPPPVPPPVEPTAPDGNVAPTNDE